jgi:hypothetical protein
LYIDVQRRSRAATFGWGPFGGLSAKLRLRGPQSDPICRCFSFPDHSEALKNALQTERQLFREERCRGVGWVAEGAITQKNLPTFRIRGYHPKIASVTCALVVLLVADGEARRTYPLD